jgi:hypothetical protein
VTLGPNEFFTVNPPDKHEFQTLDEPTKIIEIAYVKYDENDIQRDNIGGSTILDAFPDKSPFFKIACNICGHEIAKTSEMISIKEDEVCCLDCFKTHFGYPSKPTGGPMNG